MLIGLSGASRSGKTTVMKAVAERLGIPFHATSTTKVLQRLSVDLSKPLTLRERLGIQIDVFSSFIEDTAAIRQPTILDRTPIDMLAYMLCEVGMASKEDLGEDGIEKVGRYAQLCREHTAANFGSIFVLRPLPSYEAASFKPDDNPAYHQHFQLVVEGTLASMDEATCPLTAVIKESDHLKRVGLIASIAQMQLQMTAPVVSGTLQ